MSSLVIVNFNLLNQEKLAQYSEAAALTLVNYGGEFIAKGKPTTLYGESNYSVTAIIKFADKASAIAWYESDEYQKIVPLRMQAMDGVFQILS